MYSLIVSFVCLSSVAYGQESDIYSNGTGFFVSRQGEIVTNAHVVQPCGQGASIYFTSHNVRTPRKADIVMIDGRKDLALLSTGVRPARVASLRWAHTNVKEASSVFMLGYPEPTSIDSIDYSITTAVIKSMQGPYGEHEWLTFTDSARQGNSGGPLLDFAGNVIGVVTAKTTTNQLNHVSNRTTIVDTSDLAVNLPVLKDFLRTHHVHYTEKDSMLELSEKRLEQLAREYVVHLHCKYE